VKKFYASLASLVVVVSAVLLFNFMGADSNAALPRDCDTNSIINCGGITAGELADKYNQNATGDLPAIYQSYGLSASDMTHADSAAKMGEVRKDGTITVGGEVVATDAMSIGRKNIFSGSATKSIAGKTFYDTPPSRSFARDSIVAYVYFDQNGEFKAAVLTSCGNPVSGKPKPKPAYKCNSLQATKISRTEYSFAASATATGGATIVGYTYDFGDGQKADSTQTTAKHTYEKEGAYKAKLTVMVKVGANTQPVTAASCEVQVVIETPPPTPVYTCDSLTATRISRADYSFTGKATAEGGATIVNYTFDFGDGATQTVANPNNVKHTYAKDGSYTAKLSVAVKVNGSEKTATDEIKCVAKVTVSPDECKPGVPVGDARCTPCEVPGKEQYPKNSPECAATPAELPHTGPTDLLFGSLGLGSLVAASYYWYASRRGLLGALLNR